tara:strand:- start:29489 stop:30028 length:540 start_codon:yes stop_codon:yes gene_type:complete
MIYLPKRALFIHIPRTAGNSITNTIASSCAGNNYDILVCNTPFELTIDWSRVLHTHVMARVLKPHIIDWDNIFKFAIFRSEEERLNSIKRLVERDILQKTYEHAACNERWREVLLNTSTREQFYEDQKKFDLDHYTKSLTGDDLGVEIFNYNQLNERWLEICDKCQIEKCELPHLNSSR